MEKEDDRKSEKPMECEESKAVDSNSGACSSSQILPKRTLKNDDSNVYGELVVLGYNGSDIPGDIKKRRSKFVLCSGPEPNGVKVSTCYSADDPNVATALSDDKKYCVKYDLLGGKSFVTEYISDETTDMFQIGRSTGPSVDLVVFDTIPGYKRKKRNVKPPQATVSRFACRIIIDRSPVNRKVRIFCGAFDSSRNLSLGKKGTTWMYNGEPDGATTNGVLVMHPKSSYTSGRPAELWYEVSVGGEVFSQGMVRYQQNFLIPDTENSNELIDGSLIHFNGAVLLWRTTEGLKHSPNKKYLEMLAESLNGPRIDSSSTSSEASVKSSADSAGNKQSFVFIDCGHVENLPKTRHYTKNSMMGECSECKKRGMMMKLIMGLEPNIYIDHGAAICALNPCGHLCSERTMKYWIQIPIPRGTDEFFAFCPFCATPIEGDPGYTILKPNTRPQS